jgi:hypothetical protein
VAKFTFTGASPLYYIGSGLWAEPGKSYELESAPDRLWTAEGAAPATGPVSAPEPAPVAVAQADIIHAAEAALEANPALAAQIVKEASKNA